MEKRAGRIWNKCKTTQKASRYAKSGGMGLIGWLSWRKRFSGSAASHHHVTATVRFSEFNLLQASPQFQNAKVQCLY